MSRPKRGNGEGNIRQWKDGTWEARIMIGYDGKGKPKYKTFSSKKRGVVAKKLADYIANKKAVEPEVACRDTLEQWLKRWMVECMAVTVKDSTFVGYESIVNRQLIPYLGHIRLKDLKKTDIENMYAKLLKDGRADGKGGLSVSSVQHTKICLQTALKEAMKREYIIKNPAAITTVPTLKSMNGEKKEIEILTRLEQQALMAVCDESDYSMAIITALFTGVRKGELLGLMWSDINFDKKTISISRSLNRVKDYRPNAPAKTRLGIQNSTKTQSSTRIISMSDELVKRLLQYREKQQERIKKWGKAYKNQGMAFAREDGNYIDPATFLDKYFKKLEEAGIAHHTFHALRHTFATRALEAGIPIKVVSTILGHSGVEITMDIYQHVIPELQNEAMNRIADYISA